MRFWIVIGSIMLISFQACEKTVILDLDQVPSRVVIESTLTNEYRIHRVKVTRTLNFYETGRAPAITNAIVYITDDTGNRYDFEHNPEDVRTFDGVYFSENQFSGFIGRTYTLHVEVDGTTYSASDELLPVTAIDSLTYRINTREFVNPRVQGRYYEVLLYANEPQETRDYYFFKFFRNDSSVLVNATDIYFAEDTLLGENISGIASPVLFKQWDWARVEMYSLSRSGYLFYTDLRNLLNNDGGLFGSPPVNPRTNLNNNALGFFQVSAVVKESIQIR